MHLRHIRKCQYLIKCVAAGVITINLMVLLNWANRSKGDDNATMHSPKCTRVEERNREYTAGYLAYIFSCMWVRSNLGF